MIELKGASAIVTGASRGIGKAIALALAREGASVIAAARTLSEKTEPSGSLEETLKEIRSAGGNAEGIVCDVSKERDIEDLVQGTLKRFGKIDILINNAGVFHDTDMNLVDIPVETWDLTFRVNLRGPFLCIKSVLPHMIKNGRGSIINLTSLAAVRTPGKRIAYGASKAGLDRLTYGLAQEVKQHNIAVNALCPIGMADTPGARVASPGEDFNQWVKAEDVAKAAVWLAKQDGSSFTGRAVTVPASGKSTMIIYGKTSDERMWISLD
jgi:NAD(P)-dependent dehydrogenase (short-subunit alcohol dehydrogenase family)